MGERYYSDVLLWTDVRRQIYIHAGSTSVGINAIQLAHLAGYKVVTSASPRNHDLLRGFGADAVFDVSPSSMTMLPSG